MRFCAALCGACLLLAGTLPASLAASADPLTMDTVVVTADRIPEPLKQISQNVTVIEREEIARTVADSIPDLLKRHGIQTTWTGSVNYGNEAVVMRGGKSSMHGFDLAGDVLVLVDGRRVGSDNFSLISLVNVERIEIIRGPGAVQYGSSAMGGVVNVITKRGGEKPEVTLEAGGGSHDGRRYQGFVSGQTGKLDIAVWGSYAASGNYKDGHGNRVANSGMHHLSKHGFSAGWNFNEQNRLGIAYTGMDGYRLKMGPASSSTYANQYQNRDYWLMDITYEGGTADEGWSWLGRYYFGRTTYELNRESRRAASYGRRDRYSENTNDIQGGQAQVSWHSWDRLTLTGGADLLYYDLGQDQPSGLHTTNLLANYTDSEYLNIGTFLLAKLYFLEKRNLVLSGGLRYDHFSVDAKTKYAPGTARERDLHTDSSVNNWTPSVGIAYTPWEFLKLRANYAQAFRMPTPRQMGGLFSMGGSSVFIGNPDLDPEKSVTWDAGFDIVHQATTLSFTYFATRYKDMITALPAGSIPASPTDRPYVNLDKASIRGIEASARHDLGRRFDWPVRVEPYLSLTHLTTFRDGDRQPLTDIARNAISWGLVVEHQGIGLSTSLDFTYFDKRLDSVASDGSRQYTPGGSTVADFSLVQRIASFEDAGELKVRLSVRNIFDKQYSTNGEDYMPGRTFYAGIMYTF